MFHSLPGLRQRFAWRNSTDKWTGLIRTQVLSEPIGRTGKVGRRISNSGPEKGH